MFYVSSANKKAINIYLRKPEIKDLKREVKDVKSLIRILQKEVLDKESYIRGE